MMGPTRTHKTQHQDPQNSTAGPSKPRPRKNRSEKETTGVPGVQKIKSSLRQTRRLLAKDNLAADVRVETERRLRALEADLLQATSSRKQRALAVRYHKIKFFERQKVIRKLNQAKKHLGDADEDSRSEFEAAITELRVDLNYILHYPKTKKYISLFPPEVRLGEGKSMSRPVDGETAKTGQAREEVRSWIRSRMESGELPTDPELHLDTRGSSGNISSRGEERGDHNKRSMTEPAKAPDTGGGDMEEDAFFGDDDEESE
ncbi:hypothetical protein BDZ94DRAFT_1192598 [Collybia nuda]|uniref:rRNA-processing protein EFG1 n=1 Tax=Collybia nuda TaxID=64659 RepID=A0A9P5Y4T5_9AGAR|nr:hypothetical protein BDZ94DRAFT_1192598 [Collybia nuda]